MTKLFFLTFLVFSLSSCGDNSPFDEDYWDEPGRRDEQQPTNETEVRTYTADLVSLSPNFGNLSGNISITITQTETQITTQLTEVPQSLIQAQRSFTGQNCESFRNIAFPQVGNPSGEFKELNLTENGSRERLISDLNQAFPGNGDSTNLESRTVVISAFVSNNASPNPQNTTLFPIACGNLAITDSREDDGGTGGTTGGTTGTTTGVTTGATIGGTVGTIGGTTGTIGGTTVGTIGGTVGTTTGDISGVQGNFGGFEGAVGGIDGTTGTVTGGTIGTTTGSVGGVIGGATTGNVGGGGIDGTTGF